MAFKKGQSGNPDGRRKGSPDKRTALRSLLEPHAEGLVQKVVELALEGDGAALRLCLDRLIPPLKSQDSPVLLDTLEGSLAEQGSTVITALGHGQITPDAATTIMQALAAQARIIETHELDKRITALEEKRHDYDQNPAG